MRGGGGTVGSERYMFLGLNAATLTGETIWS